MGRKINLSVKYPGPMNPVLDKEIQKAIESIGAKLTGQGTDLTTGIRDIGFEMDMGKLVQPAPIVR